MTNDVEVILAHTDKCGDLVVAFIRDTSEKAGSLTLTYYGRAWTAYFGGHGCKNMKEFITRVGVDYLLDKLQSDGHMILQRYKKQNEQTLLLAITTLKNHIAGAGN